MSIGPILPAKDQLPGHLPCKVIGV